MTLPLATGGVLLVVLVWELVRPAVKDAAVRAWGSVSRGSQHPPGEMYDPGRERRAEQRARTQLRSCIAEQDWAM
jgi:hypothetical protein